MVLSTKLSYGTPNAQIFLIANIPISALAFHGLIQVHDQLDGIFYNHYL
jgi:hypothetical protein